MVNSFNLPVDIVACPTLRESSGLAMSSRNKRLSDCNKLESLIIHKTLLLAKEKSAVLNPIQVTNLCIDFFNSGNLKFEYFEIVDPLTLKTLTDTWVEGATACIVAFCGDVRLIDNLQLK